MNLSEALLERRTIKDFAPVNVPIPVLEKALAAGLWAQNHRLTQPWRFVILGGEARCTLADIAGDIQIASLPAGTEAAAVEKARFQAYSKVSSRPAAVAVSYALSEDAVQRREDFAATCCAIQNIALAAWSDGLGMLWSTSPIMNHHRSLALLGIDPQKEELVGILYFGYPNGLPTTPKRKPLGEFLRVLP